jgi:hypothetical protein
LHLEDRGSLRPHFSLSLSKANLKALADSLHCTAARKEDAEEEALERERLNAKAKLKRALASSS